MASHIHTLLCCTHLNSDEVHFGQRVGNVKVFLVERKSLDRHLPEKQTYTQPNTDFHSSSTTIVEPPSNGHVGIGMSVFPIVQRLSLLRR